MRTLFVVIAVLSLVSCDEIGESGLDFSNSLGACGGESGAGYTYDRFDPSKDEGEGFVGLQSFYGNDTGQTRENYKLLQCSSGAGVEIKTQNTLNRNHWAEDDPRRISVDPHDNIVTLSDFLDEQRLSWDLRSRASLNEFISNSEGAGFGVHMYSVYSTDQQSVCACELYYPDIQRDWAVQTDEQIAAQRERVANATELLDSILGDMDLGN